MAEITRGPSSSKTIAVHVRVSDIEEVSALLDAVAKLWINANLAFAANPRWIAVRREDFAQLSAAWHAVEFEDK